MSRNGSFAVGEFYHIYNRGTERRDIFVVDADRDRFLALMFLCNGTSAVDLKLQGRTLYDVHTLPRGETLADICLYCLMPNHFHMLVHEKSEGGISKFMQKLLTGYTMYFNRKNERTGALFQGKFKASHAADDQYLRYLASYIHLNPVKLIEPDWKESGVSDRVRAERYLRGYRYSSYLDYAGVSRVENRVINISAFPEYFETRDLFEAHTRDWLQGRTL